MRERPMTAQSRLRYARRALKQAATLIREAASLGTMAEYTRELLRAEDLSARMSAMHLAHVEAAINSFQSALRAKRARRAAA